MTEAVTHLTCENIIDPPGFDGCDGLLATVVYSTFRRPGLFFFTDPRSDLQFAAMRHPAGHRVEPHTHPHRRREITSTQEVLFVRSGRVRVTFYNSSREQVAVRELGSGDAVHFAAGGHALEMLEEAELFESKLGPYAGMADKIRFAPREGVDGIAEQGA